MPYMTSTERMLAEKYEAVGQLRGLRDGIGAILELRFGAEGLQLLPLLEAITSVEQLQAVLQTSKNATDLAEVRSLLQ
jgi:hypothetical protein